MVHLSIENLHTQTGIYTTGQLIHSQSRRESLNVWRRGQTQYVQQNGKKTAELNILCEVFVANGYPDNLVRRQLKQDAKKRDRDNKDQALPVYGYPTYQQLPTGFNDYAKN